MHMWCPDGIGRDSWDRGGRESVGWPALNSPQKGGRVSSVSVRETDRPWSKIIVVIIVVVSVVVPSPHVWPYQI